MNMQARVDGNRESLAAMAAAVMIAPRHIEIRRVAVPNPGPSQVRVRLEGCGICASNVTPWEGAAWMNFPTAPGALGHEGWGVVDALGPEVTSLKVGDRVATLFTNSFAQYDVGDAEMAVKIPAPLSRTPFPGEPLGCAMNILRRSDIRANQIVAIVGAGFLGALLTRLASQVGARVLAISRRQASLDLARGMGAAETILMDDHVAIIERVRTITRGGFCQRVIEATGKQWPLDLAGDLVCEGGRLVIAGYHQDGLRQVNMQQWNWKGIDVINAHERDRATCVRGVEDAIRATVAGLLSPERLFTHCYALEELGAAIVATRDHPPGFVKAMVRM
jgi:threonine dehydrogenase-like Zn-dependent dehydrogenase